MALSKVSRKGLVNIPARVRRLLGIEEGDYLVWDVDVEKKVAIIRVIKHPYKYLKGKYNDPRLAYNVVEEKADKLILGEANATNRA